MKLMYRYILCLIFVVLLFSCYSSSNINVKLLKVSESFLGFPYKLNPLGENSGIDKDPIYRFDSFDCMTYVETVLALSFSKNKNDFIETINNIRYKNGNVSFINRLHFQNPDWINNNKNYVQNISNIISKKLLNKNANISNILLDRQEWFKKKL